MSRFKMFLVSIFTIISVSSFAQSEMPRTISVQGYGEVSVKPDVANINFNLSATNLDFKIAIDELNTKVNSIGKALKKVGVSKNEIHSSNYNVTKEYQRNYKTGEKTFLGYKVSHSIAIQIDSKTKYVNKVFGAIINSLSDVELNLSFGVKNPEQSKDLMIRNAIKDAKNKAMIMAEVSELELGEILSINYNTSPVHYGGGNNRIMLSKRMSMDATPVMVEDFNPANIKQSTTVNIVWKIK